MYVLSLPNEQFREISPNCISLSSRSNALVTVQLSKFYTTFWKMKGGPGPCGPPYSYAPASGLVSVSPLCFCFQHYWSGPPAGSVCTEFSFSAQTTSYSSLVPRDALSLYCPGNWLQRMSVFDQLKVVVAMLSLRNCSSDLIWVSRIVNDLETIAGVGELPGHDLDL